MMSPLMLLGITERSYINCISKSLLMHFINGFVEDSIYRPAVLGHGASDGQ